MKKPNWFARTANAAILALSATVTGAAWAEEINVINVPELTVTTLDPADDSLDWRGQLTPINVALHYELSADVLAAHQEEFAAIANWKIDWVLTSSEDLTLVNPRTALPSGMTLEQVDASSEGGCISGKISEASEWVYAPLSSPGVFQLSANTGYRVYNQIVLGGGSDEIWLDASSFVQKKGFGCSLYLTTAYRMAHPNVVITLQPYLYHPSDSSVRYSLGEAKRFTFGLPNAPKAVVTKNAAYNKEVNLVNVNGILSGGYQYGTVTPNVAYTFEAKDTSEEASAGAYSNWKCDYIVSMDADTDAYSIGLFGQYGWGAVAFPSPVDAKAGQKIPLLMSVTKNGWNYSDIVRMVRSFTCGAINFSEENIGKTITVSLVMWNEDNPVYKSYENPYVVEEIKYKFETVTPLFASVSQGAPAVPVVYRKNTADEYGFSVDENGYPVVDENNALVIKSFNVGEPHFAMVADNAIAKTSDSSYSTADEAVATVEDNKVITVNVSTSIGSEAAPAGSTVTTTTGTAVTAGTDSAAETTVTPKTVTIMSGTGSEQTGKTVEAYVVSQGSGDGKKFSVVTDVSKDETIVSAGKTVVSDFVKPAAVIANAVASENLEADKVSSMVLSLVKTEAESSEPGLGTALVTAIGAADKAFEVHPVATITTTTEEGATATTSYAVANSELAEDASFTFTLDFGAENAGKFVSLTHYAKDGTVKKHNGKDSWTETLDANGIATVTLTEFSYLLGTVSEEPPVTYVAQIGTTKYESLAAAVAAVPTDGMETTITMLAGETIVADAGITIAAGKNIVLDLNGQTVQMTAASADERWLIKNEGSLTVKDSAENGKLLMSATGQASTAVRKSTIKNMGSLTVESGTIELTYSGTTKEEPTTILNDASDRATSLTAKGGTVVNSANRGTGVYLAVNDTNATVVDVQGGRVEGYGSAVRYYFDDRALTDAKLTFSMSNGTIHGRGMYGIHGMTTSSKDWNGISFDISGGTISCVGLLGRKHVISPLQGAVSISGGTFNGDVYIYGHYLNITDGNFNGAVTLHRVKESLASASISGGQFKGALTIAETTNENTINPYYNAKFVSGGIYGTAPAARNVVDGNVVVDNTDSNTQGDYPKAIGGAVASVDVDENTTYYATLADAIAAANEAGVDEITILNGATESPDTGWKVADGKLVRKSYVAQIGTAKYESLADAYANAGAGDTIVLLADITGPVEFAKKTLETTDTITLDLNGKTITAGSTGSTLQVSQKAGLVITDSDPEHNGKIENTGSKNAIQFTLTSGTPNSQRGPVTITGGTISADREAIMVDNGSFKLTINGEHVNVVSSSRDAIYMKKSTCSIQIDSGTITGGTNYAALKSGSTLGKGVNNVTITGGTLTGDTYAMDLGLVNSSIAITDGTLVGGTSAMKYPSSKANFVSGGTFSSAVPETACAAGYIPAEKDSETGMYTVKTGLYVAQIGTTKYETLAEAIAAVPTTGAETTITMIANSAEPAVITVASGKNVVLDLNGKTVSYTTDAKSVYFLTNEGTLTIQDNSENADGQILLTAQPDTGYSVENVTIYNCGGTLTLVSGTVKNATGGGLAYAVKNSSNAWGAGDYKVSTFNMTGGKVSAPGGDAALRVYQNCAAHVAPVSKNYVNISGGTIVDTGIFVDTVLYTDSGIQEGFADSIDTQINISGGTVNGLIDLKIRHKNNTKLTITGGDFTNAKMWVRKYASEYKGDEPTDPMVYISGGKFAFIAGKAFGLAYDCGTSSWTSYEKPYAVSGGVFNVEVPATACAEGCEPAANTDAETKAAYPYTVNKYVAQIVETGAKYFTLAAALAAAQDGQTVKLLADAAQNDGIIFDKAGAGVILDLDSKTFTVNTGANCNNRAFRIDNGTLTVKNGSIVAAGSGTTSSNGAGCYGAFRVEKDGTLNVQNATLSNSRPWGLNVKILGGRANLERVTINSSYGGGIEVTEADLGALSQSGYAELTDCTFIQTGYFDHCSTALSVSGGSELVVNSGTYTSENYGIYVFSSGGKVTVKGGTITGESQAAVKAEMDTNTYPAYTGAVQISGGRFTGALSVTSPASMSISGGVFTVPVAAQYCAKGYEPADNTDDATMAAYRYTVGKQLAVVDAATGTAEMSKALDGYTFKMAVSQNGDVAEVSEVATPVIPADDLPASGEYATYAFTAVKGGVETPVQNTVGILRVADAVASTNTVIAVPWQAFGDKIAIGSLVYLGNREAGDQLMAYDAAKGTYYSWTLEENAETKALVWTADKTVKTGLEEAVEAPAASAFEVVRGQGVFLKRKDPSKPIYLVGRAPASGETVAVTTTLAASSESKPAWTLVAAPSKTPLDLNASGSPFRSADSSDTIMLVSAGGVAMKIPYTYKNGKWGRLVSKTVEETRANGKTVKYTYTERDEANCTIPAGTGFWYLNKGGKKTVEW